MKKQILSAGLLLLACFGTAEAQVSNVNPVPQEVAKAGEALFDAPTAWNVVCDKNRVGGYAAQLLATAAPKADANATMKVTLGVRGDKTVKRYGKHIPKQTQGYWLSITPEQIVIAGHDEAGLFYGVQTLLDIMEQGKLEACTVTDWPDVKFRGVVEGFYGTPWSHEARLDQLTFYRENKLNVYIYGPKDDPWHRDKWREPYPENEAKRISELANFAKECGVNFYWAIHPGVDIKWTDEDRDYLMAKFEKMYELGVRSFAVFFDDIWGEGTKADKQAALLNYVDNNFVQKKPDVAPLILCPTEYNKSWANDEKGYLRTLGSQMNKTIEIMWTGNSVVACIDKPTMDWVNERIQRKGYIWWNYPVSDFVQSNVLLGPVYGNGLDIANDVSGFVSNPMEHAEASKIALYGVADYTWNMKAFNSEKNWEDAIKDLLPDNATALRTFALYNKDLGPNGHGFRRNEGEELKDLAEAVKQGNQMAIANVMLKSTELKLAADLLLADKSNPRLVRELMPWLLQARLLSEYGSCVATMALTHNAKSQQGGIMTFDALYKQARYIREQMYVLGATSDTRHKHQSDIKLGGKVFLPMLNDMFANAVNAYNKANGTNYEPVAEYLPFKLSSNVAQLALLPITGKGGEVRVKSSNEVINWQNGGELLITMERPVTLRGLDFDLGVTNQAENFKLEAFVGGEWKNISLLYYRDGETVVHTGNEIGGMRAEKLRLTNTSGKDLQVYFRNFKFNKD